LLSLEYENKTFVSSINGVFSHKKNICKYLRCGKFYPLHFQRGSTKIKTRIGYKSTLGNVILLYFQVLAGEETNLLGVHSRNTILLSLDLTGDIRKQRAVELWRLPLRSLSHPCQAF
jgi:hypothetical protein